MPRSPMRFTSLEAEMYAQPSGTYAIKTKTPTARKLGSVTAMVIMTAVDVNNSRVEYRRVEGTFWA